MNTTQTENKMRQKNKIYSFDEALEIMDAIIGDEDTEEQDFKKYQELEKKAAAVKTDGGWVRSEEDAKKFNDFSKKLVKKYGEDKIELLRIWGINAALKGRVTSSPIGKRKNSAGNYGIEA